MKRLFKDAGLITGGVVLFVGVVTGIFTLVSLTLHDSPQVLYDFAISAKSIHDSIEGTDFLPKIEAALAAISKDPVENASEIDDIIREGTTIQFTYRESYEDFPPTRDTLELHSSLLRESRLISSCYSNLSFAWSFKKSGNNELSAQYRDKASDNYLEIKNLRPQNTIYLDNLLLKAELELNESKN